MRNLYWRLSPSVTACIAADRVLLLDVARDRYFALPPALNNSLRTWLEQIGEGRLPDDLHRALGELGVIPAGDPVPAAAQPCPVVRSRPIDSAPLPATRLRPRAVWQVAHAVRSAAKDVRQRRLGSILTKRFDPTRERLGGHGDLRSKLAEFRAIRPLIPVPRVCLHDCLALLDWLGPARGGAQLVLGVSAYPFAAHCWVQQDGELLDDHPESPSRFEPILHFP